MFVICKLSLVFPLCFFLLHQWYCLGHFTKVLGDICLLSSPEFIVVGKFFGTLSFIVLKRRSDRPCGSSEEFKGFSRSVNRSLSDKTMCRELMSYWWPLQLAALYMAPNIRGHWRVFFLTTDLFRSFLYMWQLVGILDPHTNNSSLRLFSDVL